MRFLTLLVLMLLAALPLRAEESIVAGLSQNRVSITTDFVGSNILIFGAVKREAMIPTDPLDVVIVVEGPKSEVLVRRKERRAGIWVNAEAVPVAGVPSFYAVASSGPLDAMLPGQVDEREGISVRGSLKALVPMPAPEAAEGEAPTDAARKAAQDEADFIESFPDAVVRIRTDEGFFSVTEGAVSLREETLFETRFELPSNLTEGAYRARIFLLRGGEVVSRHVANIDVRKVGLERWLYTLAHENALLYALMSIVIAVIAGWGASAFFRMISRG